MANQVREPKQERSIEKKNKIIKAGYKLFSEVGYYRTNTPEIAAEAGVSTGIVYGYFKDKSDILYCALEIYLAKVCDPIFSLLNRLTAPIDFPKLAALVVDQAIEIHSGNSRMHEALHSMTHTDKKINDKFLEFEDAVTLNFSEKLKNLGAGREDLKIRTHLAMDLIQSFSHEAVFDRHAYIDYARMRELVIDMVVKLFE